MWWYISFADGPFLGGVHVEAETFVDAVFKTKELGINPGGEALGMALPGMVPADQYVNRLLTKEEIEACALDIMNRVGMAGDADMVTLRTTTAEDGEITFEEIPDNENKAGASRE